MPRPRKWRRVCELPATALFGPLNRPGPAPETITMTVDEYETLRLVDHQGLTQEQCAQHMNIARSTVQGIYTDARTKVAQALVEGKILSIQGGDYQLCDGLSERCGQGSCGRHRRGRGRGPGREGIQ